MKMSLVPLMFEVDTNNTGSTRETRTILTTTYCSNDCILILFLVVIIINNATVQLENGGPSNTLSSLPLRHLCMLHA
jgi:hypothetical protein